MFACCQTQIADMLKEKTLRKEMSLCDEIEAAQLCNINEKEGDWSRGEKE